MKKLLFAFLIIPILSVDSQTWLRIELNIQVNLNDISFYGPDHAWIVGDSGTIFRYSSENWQKIESGTIQNLRAVHIVDTNNIWMAGDNGTILNYNSGESLTYVSPVNVRLNDIFMLDSNGGWIAGNSGTILEFLNNEWHLYNVPNVNNDLQQIDFYNDTTGMMVGFWGLVLQYNGEWQNVTAGNTVDHCSVCYLDSNNYLIGTRQTGHWSLHSTWIKKYPSAQVLYSNGSIAEQISAIRVIDSVGWAVGREGNIFIYNGLNFQYFQNAGTQLNSMWMVNDTTAWAVGNNGYLLQYSQNAQSINEISPDEIKVYPNPFTDYVFVQSHNGEIDEIHAINSSGQTIHSIIHAKNEDMIRVNLSFAKAGMIFLKIISGNSVVVRKIIKY